MKHALYICINSYWPNSNNRWLGPYKLAKAEAALALTRAVRTDKDEYPTDERNQVQVLGVLSSKDSVKEGRSPNNTMPAQDIVPDDRFQLRRLTARYLERNG